MRRSQSSRLFLAVVLVLVVVLSFPVPAFLAGELTVKVAALDSSKFPAMQMVVSVAGDGGRYVAGLKPDNFTVTEDGQAVKVSAVTTASDANIDLAVAVVIDTSGSMAGDAMDKTRSSAVEFVKNLGEKDQVGVFAFGGKVCKVTDVITARTDKGAVINAINLNLPPAEGDTPFYDAVYQAVQSLAQTGSSRRVIVALTDGEDTCSLVQPGSVIDAANRAGISIYTIGLGASLKPDVVDRMARLTGGVLLSASDPKDLAGLYTTLSDLFKQQYVLRFASSALCDGKEHKLSIVATSQDKTGQDEKSFTAPKGASVCAPRIALNLESGGTVNDSTVIVPTVDTQGGGLSKVEYAIDGKLMATATQPPYAFTVPMLIAPGQHTLTVFAYDSVSPEPNMATKDITFTKGGQAPSVAAATPGLASVPTVVPTVVTPPRSELPVGLIMLLGLLLALMILAFVLFRRRPANATTLSGGTNGSVDTMFPDSSGGVGSTGGIPIPTGLIGGDSAGGNAPLRSDETQILNRKTERPAWLVALNGPCAGQKFDIHATGSTAIGREGPADSIVIDDPSISRQHAKIKFEGGQFSIIDLGATNPTRVNGQIVARQVLADGDQIQLGETTVVFKLVPK